MELGLQIETLNPIWLLVVPGADYCLHRYLAEGGAAGAVGAAVGTVLEAAT